jgi:DNA-binding transcriptional ArsR family regulator
VSSTGIESTRVELRAALFAALGDPIRLRILDSLSADQRCVCEIQEHLTDVAPNLLSYPDAPRTVTAALPVGFTSAEPT